MFKKFLTGELRTQLDRTSRGLTRTPSGREREAETGGKLSQPTERRSKKLQNT